MLELTFIATVDQGEPLRMIAQQAYEEWRRSFRATVANKHVIDRHESDRIGSTLLPLQVKAYIIVRLAA